MQRARELVRKVLLRCIVEPALNKWTKVDPAFCSSALLVFFFRLVVSALELKVGATYEAVTALSQDLHGGGDGGGEGDGYESYKGRVMRYSKRCLAFLGDAGVRAAFLVWLAVGGTIMGIHYRLFKKATWHSHCKVTERCTVFDCLRQPPGAKPSYQRCVDRFCELLR